ncbi:MAG: hypothetical protein ACJ756_07075, partial [Solirubrobacterales bacterium]
MWGGQLGNREVEDVVGILEHAAAGEIGGDRPRRGTGGVEHLHESRLTDLAQRKIGMRRREDTARRGAVASRKGCQDLAFGVDAQRAAVLLGAAWVPLVA